MASFKTNFIEGRKTLVIYQKCPSKCLNIYLQKIEQFTFTLRLAWHTNDTTLNNLKRYSLFGAMLCLVFCYFCPNNLQHSQGSKYIYRKLVFQWNRLRHLSTFVLKHLIKEKNKQTNIIQLQLCSASAVAIKCQQALGRARYLHQKTKGIKKGIKHYSFRTGAP